MNAALYDELKQTITLALTKATTQADVSLTDMYLSVKPEEGLLVVYDDNQTPLLQVTLDSWTALSPKGTHLQDEITRTLQAFFEKKEVIDLFDNLDLIAPFSVILIDEEHQPVCELMTIDRDMLILSGDFFAHYEQELDTFFERLMNEAK